MHHPIKVHIQTALTTSRIPLVSLCFPCDFPQNKTLCVGGPASLDARQALRLAGGVWVLRGARRVCRLPFGLTYHLGPESDMRFLLGVEFVWFDLRPLYRNVDHFRGSSNHFSGSRDRSIRLIYPESTLSRSVAPFCTIGFRPIHEASFFGGPKCVRVCVCVSSDLSRNLTPPVGGAPRILCTKYVSYVWSTLVLDTTFLKRAHVFN